MGGRQPRCRWMCHVIDKLCDPCLECTPFRRVWVLTLKGRTFTMAAAFSEPDLFRHFLIVALTSSEMNGGTKGIFQSIKNVTHNIINDSVRVDGRGEGTIHDVQLTEKAAIHEDTDSPKVAEIRAKHENKLQEVNELKDRVSVAQKRVEVLDKLVEGGGVNVVCPPKDSREPFILNNETLNSLIQFYSFYEENSTSFRTELRKAKTVLEKSERELDALEAELSRAESDRRANQFSKVKGAAEGGSLFESAKAEMASYSAPKHVETATMKPAVVEPAQHTLSTEFKITKSAAIPSDGAEHKTNMKYVSPDERFSCSLGVDTALRVEYKPVKKYHEQVRLIAPVVSQTDEEVNNREGDLTTPAELPKEGCRLKSGILEWTIALQNGKTAELHVKWTVDHPKDEVVEFVERY
uniref:DUF4140 domain-containing protein n=1 Tax=Haemonchus contortus TaxID=6289 RepID=W6NH38_HAECO